MELNEHQVSPKERPILKCPRCNDGFETHLEPGDPMGTAMILCLCPACNPDGFEEIHYFDAKGKELIP